MTGSVKLRAHPGDIVQLACYRCGRAVLKRDGEDIECRELRTRFTAAA